ncbi:MAG: Gfo/Idh/MocA family oxidoreductase [Puniceicoccales bacterium]|jgi:predicted dehydrogenase|nr:Gfo/Idh/MocA family oxidoreductase [Puniceicoccales bacterium]
MNRLSFLQHFSSSLAVGAAGAGLFTLGGRALAAGNASAGAAAAGAGGRKVRIGFIGCGGRATWIAPLFQKHGGYEFVGAADYFPDRAARFARRFGIPAERAFSGLDGHKRLLDTKPDAVAIIAVPWFHPTLAANAVAAGVHVYQAKPVAVDVPGCHAIERAGAAATASGRVFLVDFQTRANPFYIEAMRRVNTGAIGERVFGECFYHTDMHAGGRRGKLSAEDMLRQWVVHRALGGEIIVEQNIHALDVMHWAFNNTPPVQAFGTADRRVRLAGDQNDHYTLHFLYPNNVGVTFASHQHRDFGTRPDGISMRLFCTKGVLESDYFKQVLVRGDGAQFYRGGKVTNLYTTGAEGNIAAFHAAIAAGDCANPTVAISARSNLISILASAAGEARCTRAVTWDEVVNDTNRIEFDTRGMKS